MASCTRNARFELRRNQSSNWTSVNPTLLSGEPGVELDTGQMKIGDGIRTWSLLPYVGNTSAGSTGPLIFTASQQSGKDLRTLTGYYENSVTKPVRDTYFTATGGGQQLVLVLASFSPTLSSVGLSNSSLLWDYPAEGFSVTVTNPNDFSTEYISSVSSVTQQSGTVSALGLFTARPQTPTAAGGVSWTQQFLTNGTGGVIRPISSTISGGSASATVRFNYINGSSPETVYTTTSTWTINWTNPSTRLVFNSVATKTFLDFYPSITYYVSYSGINDTNNIGYLIVPTGGSINAGTLTFTFTTPIIKDNMATTRALSLTTTFTRPANVTGTSYTAVTASSETVTVGFTYPSFLIFSPTFANIPKRSDIVTGNSFSTNVTLLGDKQNTYGPLPLTNSSGNPIALWFAVEASVSPQPTTFKAGPDPANLAKIDYYSIVVPPAPQTVALYPDNPLIGYMPVTYNLYGITLNPGITYVQVIL